MSRKLYFLKSSMLVALVLPEFVRSLLFLIALGCLILPLHATDYTWQAATGGDFGDAANWNPSGIPGSADRAFFNSGSGTVNATTLGASTTISQWVINTDLTFDFGGKTLIADSASAYNPDLNVTASSATLTNGSYSAVVAQVGSSSGSTLNVSGSGTSFTVAGNFFETGIAMSSNTNGAVVISNGANMTINTLEFDIGGGPNTDNVNAELHITGSGTTAALNGITVAVGSYFSTSDNNVGTLRISDGASVTGTSSLSVGQSDRSGSSGALIVESGASLNNSGSIQVGSINDAGNSAVLRVQTGGTYTLNSGEVHLYANSQAYVGTGSVIEGGVIQNNYNNSSDGASATVMGSGTIRSTAATFNQYGILRPGDSPDAAGIGTLHIGDGTASTNMTLNSLSTMYFEFNGTNTTQFDRVLVTGSITGTAGSGGNLVLDFNFVPTSGATFTIMNASEGWSDLIAAGFTVTWGGYATDGDVNIVGNDFVVSNVVVPEPSVYMLTLAGSAGLLILLWRKKTVKT